MEDTPSTTQKVETKTYANSVVDSYFQLKATVHAMFGYKEDWVVIPLKDRREYWWALDLNNRGGGSVHFNEEKVKFDAKLSRENQFECFMYCDEIYTQRFLPKWVYETDDLTLVCVDTHTDGNKFLAVFDNSKRLREFERAPKMIDTA